MTGNGYAAAPAIDISRFLAPQAPADWKLPPRYKYKKLIGAGSYGSVCEALDLHGSDSGTRVAIKKMDDIFNNVWDAKRILREITILRQLRARSTRHVVGLLDVIPPDKPGSFDGLYLVLEYAGQDLRKLSQRRNIFLTEGRIKHMLSTLLIGLQELHALGICHRDLKPANCLVPEVAANAPDEQWEIKICDFGHARMMNTGAGSCGAFVSTEQDLKSEQAESDVPLPVETKMRRSFTCHVATRWYRAPELILLRQHYIPAAVDVWSVGCVAAELFGMLPENVEMAAQRGPLLPGGACFPLSPSESETMWPDEGKLENETKGLSDDSRDQLALILNLVGTPEEDEIEEVFSGPRDVVAEASLRYLRSFPVRKSRDLQLKFPGSSESAVELLANMLRFSPKRRCTVKEALDHSFLQTYSQARADHEVVPLEPLEFETEGDLSEERLRELMLQEVQHFHPELEVPLKNAGEK